MSPRDFFLHLFTITCGLLIALGLENAAEAMHHRHQRKEAEANIRQELTQNRAFLLQHANLLQKENADLTDLLTLVDTRSTGGKVALTHLQVSFNEEPIPDAAWRTASSTGVLSFMDYGEVQQFADAYKQQDMLQTAEEQALNDYFQCGPILQMHGKDMTPEQARDALPLLRAGAAHLTAMYALGAGTLAAYDKALK